GKWPYHHADGQLVGYAVRFNFETEGKAEKEVLPITYCSVKKGGHMYTAWRSSGVPAPRPLYRLPQLVTAPGKPLIFTEGEKKADRAVELLPDYTMKQPQQWVERTHLSCRTSPHLQIVRSSFGQTMISRVENMPNKWPNLRWQPVHAR